MSEWDSNQPLEDWEYPDPDEYDEEEVDTIVCPECGRDVYEESPSCPECGHFFTADDLGTAAKLPFGWLGVLIVVALVLAFLGLGW
jgi:RNA polymerase subunit RPABC4/transcription elongation factor Spt4